MIGILEKPSAEGSDKHTLNPLDRIIKTAGATLEQCIDWKLLAEHTTRFDFRDIMRGDVFQWRQLRNIRHLHLLGNAYPSNNFPNEEHLPGIYLNDSREWAVWIGCSARDIQAALELYPEKLEKLTIRLTDLEEFNLEEGITRFTNQKTYGSRRFNIEALRNLRSLSLERNRRLNQIIGLDLLEQLESLNIQYTAVKTLSLHYPLENVTELYASNTPLEDASFLEFFPALEALWLNHTHITQLPSLEGFGELRKLSLTGTPIRSLDNCRFPSGLRSLYLKDMPLKRLPDSIGQLQCLRRLVLSGLTLEELPVWLADLRMSFSREANGGGIRLYNTTVEGVDMSIFDQSQEMILEWFRERAADKHKIFSFGLGGIGKSVFVSRLIQNMKDSLNLFGLYLDTSCSMHDAAGILHQTAKHFHPEQLEPRFGFEPFDFGKYYYPSKYPERFTSMPRKEESPIRWSCGRYTPAGCFDNEDWNPNAYLPAWNARKPIYLDDVPEEEAADKESAKPLNELKVVFLGDGGAGKSHTIARLLKDGGQTDDFPNISTPGIVIKDKPYKFEDKEVKVHFWDFGGQEILHSMHRMFLTKRTLYVVMLNVRDGTQDDRARYWLYNLRSFAKDAPVLLVLNQMDMNENATLNESDLRKLYPTLAPEVVKLSTLKDTDADFEKKFIDVLRRQIGGMDILTFPFTPSWSRLKEKLQDMEKNYIFGDDFQKICDECGVTVSDNIRRDLLNWFSDLGVSFCYSGSASLEDYVVLRPDWITNAIYIVLFNKAETANNGQVSHEVIYKMLSSRDMEKYRRTVTTATYKSHEVDYVLKVFRKFRLSFLAEDGIEFLPMLCEANAKPVSATYENDPDALEFRMHYEYLPNNVIHRLMVDRRRELNLSNVWLYGGQFRNDCTGLSAVVKTEGNLLRIMVRRENSECAPQLYLDALKKDIERINGEMGLTVANTEVVYKADGKTACFDYEDLLFAQEMRDTHISCKELRKKIPLADILKQSGHSADKAQEELLTDIVHYCEMLQDDKTTWNKSEDERTHYIRNLLRSKGYIAEDQSRGGVSTGGEQAGELDLDIRLKPAERLTIFEALNLSGSSESRLKYWNAHLDKLLDNYNATGCPFLFHVTYLSCVKNAFEDHCVAFADHMRYYSPRGFSLTSERPTDPLAKRGIRHGGFLRAMECVYDCGGIPMTVYHFFVRIGKE